MIEQRLPQLRPFSELSDRARDKLLQHARTMTVDPGFKLHARDEFRSMIFLLEGRMILASGRNSVMLKGDSSEALNPLFDAHDYHSHAIAATRSTLAMLDRKVYETLIDGGGQDSVEVSEIELSDLEGELFSSIYTHAYSGELALPQLPEVALHLQRALKDPDVSIAEATRIIEEDPSVAGRLLSVANSPAMGSRRVVSRLQDAVARLGLERTRQLVMALAMHQVFIHRDNPYHELLERLWRRSARIAAVSCVLADQCEAADPQSALLAGLLHRVGALPVIAEVARTHPDRTPGEVERVLFRLEGLIGELVAQQWDLASDIIEAIRDSGGPENPEAHALTDIVRIARAACPRDAEDDLLADRIPLTDLRAVERLGFILDEDGNLPAIETARQEVEALIREVA
ncbi:MULTISPECIES: HDOD domain-containing protein [Thioalkalivibrio]|uniref:HDOD domain-containing protein n=1 Tax=Thioalkalivibrio TaxID=106633 RepID=UPI000366CB09|nr:MULTISPECIES: HDOD domain-containing protein [Thioalkalivibrio]OOC48049.1 HDOD domain-containing protein [Thioalkalivibrio versutus]